MFDTVLLVDFVVDVVDADETLVDREEATDLTADEVAEVSFSPENKCLM